MIAMPNARQPRWLTDLRDGFFETVPFCIFGGERSLPKITLIRQFLLPVNAVVSTVCDGLPTTNAVISAMIEMQNSGRKWTERTAQAG